MVALAADKDTSERQSAFSQRVGDFGTGAIVDSTTIYKGALVAYDTNDDTIKEAATSTTLIALGVCREQVVTGASNTADPPQVDCGIFKFENSAGGDEILDNDCGAVCYIVDDQTVALTDGTSTRSVAGLVFKVESDGVLVAVNPFVIS